LTDGFLLAATFVLGGLLSRVSLCTVAAAQQCVVGRDARALSTLVLAASGAGVSLLLLAALLPDSVRLPADAQFRWGILGGGLLLGIGALINGGCYLGSVLYLGTGNVNFLFTLLGIGVGLHGANWLAPLAPVELPGLRMAMGAMLLAGLGVSTLVAIVVLSNRRKRELWLALSAGLVAGLVFARQPAWSYGSALESLVRRNSALVSWSSVAAALGLFAGAVIGATLGGRFRLQPFRVLRALRCLAGGAIMGFGAALVPGGNDNLLLWAIPGLAAYGFLAYGLMLGSILAAFALAAYWPRTTRPPAQ
jgi:toxin CptA